jgi:hypothetical protein
VARLAQPDADVECSSGRRRIDTRPAPGRFFIATVASSTRIMPPICLQVPVLRYTHSSRPLSTLAWPAQVCDPDRLAQSFWPAFATP